MLRLSLRAPIAARATSTLSVAANYKPCNPFEVKAGYLQPGLPASEFQERRKKLFALMPTNTAFITNAASVKYMTHDIPWEFHQDTNFMYLTGLEELTHTQCFLRLRMCVLLFFFYSSTFVEATKSYHNKFFMGDSLIEQLRVIKSENELNRMRFAAEIGTQGFIDMMKNTRPGMSELALGSTFEGSIKKNGALWNAFPNVVGSGSNAAVIHYLAKRGMLHKHDLVLVDSGCEVAGVTFAISRAHGL
ncbi:putative peptidase M24, aminopeptidase P, creatinase/Aminopeptidase P/Spt16 [Plasmopara halstedii]